MNGNDPQIEAAAFVLPTFPTWPPPSGGAPVTVWEQSPKINPFPYGSPQTANISTAPPSPVHPYSSTFFPKKMPTGANGQNQPQTLPTLPHSRFNVLPGRASPLFSAMSPLPIMGPGATVTHLTASQVGRMGTSGRTFPAGSYIDGYGNVVTPTRIIGGLGN